MEKTGQDYTVNTEYVVSYLYDVFYLSTLNHIIHMT